MIYYFMCEEHGTFEVKQGMMEEHKAKCAACGKQASRVYVPLPFQFGRTDYNKDGSRDLTPDLPHVPEGTKYTQGWTPKEGGYINVRKEEK